MYDEKYVLKVKLGKQSVLYQKHYIEDNQVDNILFSTGKIEGEIFENILLFMKSLKSTTYDKIINIKV